MVRTKTTRTVTWLTILSVVLTMSMGNLFRGWASAKALDGKSIQANRTRKNASNYPELSHYATDLTAAHNTASMRPR